MPKVSPLIPNELLLSEFDHLSPLIQLIPEQASMLMGISLEQMKSNRREGHPPPHTKQGGSIRYQLGAVREYLKSQPSFNNELEAFAYKMGCGGKTKRNVQK